MINDGYILLARKSLDSEIWNKPPLYWKIWNFILFKAFYKDKGSLVKGEFFTTIDELKDAGKYYVGYRKITPSTKQIRTIIEFLRKPNEVSNEIPMIDITKVKNGMVIKVNKYCIYQDISNYEGQTKDTRKTYEGNTKGTTYKKEIKNKEINKYIGNLPTYNDSKNMNFSYQESQELLQLMGKDN